MTATKRILIVDDDRETCRLIAELIGGPGRIIADAVTAADALEQIRSQFFDLVISDINLNARESGLDVLKAIKAANPAGQVVLISAFGTLETAIAAVRAGAFDYVSKPFNIGEVKATVERALARRRGASRRLAAGGRRARRASSADAAACSLSTSRLRMPLIRQRPC